MASLPLSIDASQERRDNAKSKDEGFSQSSGGRVSRRRKSLQGEKPKVPSEKFARILAVEDNATELRLLTDILEEDGFQVIGCTSAAEALRQLEPGRFGVGVVDLMLPDLDGIALLQEILKIDPDVRVIIYTGASSFDSVKEALNAGAFGYIEKLSDPSELLRHVHRAARARVGRYAADLEAAVAKRTEELARSNQELQSFASVVAHDLRSPLLTISGYCEILKEEFGSMLPPGAIEYLEQITMAAGRMGRLIDDLLDYSRVGRGRDPMRTVDLHTVVEQVRANLDAAIRDANATIQVDRLPPVRGDQTQLIQLFQNLVGNAIKFRDARPIVVSIRCEVEGAMHRFAVADNGIGIDRKDFERIFRVFQRLHGKEYPGTGIGLALCQKIVERHGGRIWLESQLGQGSTFYFTLPAADPRTDSAG